MTGKKPKSESVQQRTDGAKHLKGKRGSIAERENRIIELVRSNGFMAIDELSRRFSLTQQTIRRDINRISRKGLLQRHHGGAGMVSSIENVAYSTRKILCLQEKKRIARKVSEMIPDKASLCINIGTTTEEVAKALLQHHNLRVITNNLNVAVILSANESFEIIVAGGQLRNRDRAVTGQSATDFINHFKVDFGIIGISGIDQDGSLLDFDYQEVRVARAIINNSRRVFLVTDHTKFSRNAVVRLGNITEIDALFTDQPPPAEINDLLQSAGVSLHLPA
ncbi:MAG: DeoR family transcriptional regulator [Desulfohalobiaceae bacterium]|nr:DeoR family transcriptional regulator [Desulfohalobiaceae bacterium]